MPDPIEKPEKKARRRRSPEDARRAILDAAGGRLQRDGPDGLRLQAIAADLGLTHSSILHHFGSREGLLDALSEDALAALDRDLLASLEAPPDERGADRASDLLGRVARTLGDEGHASLLAWQFISGRLPRSEESDPPPHQMLGRIADTVHRVRAEHARQHALPVPLLDDTRAFVLMISCSLFGEALAGEVFSRSVGLDPSPNGRLAYRRWLADQTTSMLFGEREPADDRPG